MTKTTELFYFYSDEQQKKYLKYSMTQTELKHFETTLQKKFNSDCAFFKVARTDPMYSTEFANQRDRS